jgi:prevent-host-death family protein
MAWQLQTAKQKFSELVERALAEGPQVVTRRGREVVVVVAIDEYRRLRSEEPDFKRWLLDGPRAELDIERDRDPGRDIEF